MTSILANLTSFCQFITALAGSIAAIVTLYLALRKLKSDKKTIKKSRKHD